MVKLYGVLACALVALAVSPPGENEAAKLEAKTKPAADSDYSPAEAEQRIEKTLGRPLRNPVDFTETPLNQALMQIGQDYELPVLIDGKALEAAAASPEAPITLQLGHVSLRAALDLMMRQVEDLTYMIDNEVLTITTKDAADKRIKVQVYRVDDLLRRGQAEASPTPEDYDYDSLIEIVTSSVEHDTWKENGAGEGEIHPYAPGMLVVSQTRTVHNQIERLLVDMRRVKGDIESSTPSTEAASAAPITRGFAIDENALGGSDQSRDQIREAIMRSVDWKSGGDAANSDQAFLYVLPHRVLVRNRPQVVRQVERAMADLGAKPTSTGGGRGGGFF